MDNEMMKKQSLGKRKVYKIIFVLLLVVSLICNGVLGYLYLSSTEEVLNLNAVYSEEFFHYNSLTVEAFEEKVASGDDFIAIVSRPNCGSCEFIYEEVMQATAEMGINDELYFVNVVYLHQDTDSWNAFKEKYGFSGTPTYARFANGEPVSIIGWTPERGVNAQDAELWLLEQMDLFEK